MQNNAKHTRRNRQINRCLRMLIALAGLAGTATTAGAQNPKAGSAPVTVQNTSTNPVPVAGAVAVTNTAGNPVPISGTVAISNPASQSKIKNIDEPGRSPYQSTFTSSFATCSARFDPVPPNKRLVVQHVSVFAHVNSTSNLSYVILTSFHTNNVNDGIAYLNATKTIPNETPNMVISQQLTAYVDAGGAPYLAFDGILGGPGGADTCNVVGYLSGYLIDLTQ